MRKSVVVLLLVSIILVIGGIGGYIYLKESTKTVIHNGLSDRSKAFIASQSSRDGGSWQSVDFDKKRAGESDFDSNRVTVENCYSLVVPFRVSDDRMNEPCVYYAIIESPRGTMTTNLRSVGFPTVDESPDVTFRRSKKEQYTEEVMNVKNIKYLVFTDKTTGTEKTAFGMQPSEAETHRILTVSLAIGASQDVQTRQMKKILESVEVE